MNQTETEFNNYNIYFPDGENIKFPSDTTIKDIKRKIAKDRYIDPNQIKFYGEGDEEEILRQHQRERLIKDGVITLFALIKNIIKFSDVEEHTLDFNEFKDEEGEIIDALDNFNMSGFSIEDNKLSFTLNISKGDGMTERTLEERVKLDEETCSEYIAILVWAEDDEDEYANNLFEYWIYANNTIVMVDSRWGDEFDLHEADIYL
jgi:hypothetical protein